MFKKFVGYLLIVASVIAGLGAIFLPLSLAALGSALQASMCPGYGLSLELVAVVYWIALCSPYYWATLIGIALTWRVGKWLV